ncbi:MAG: VOC family protein [Chloroflexi bacterium]|nr:MAG: VOC family protein [Chloroflexota bacterium]
MTVADRPLSDRISTVWLYVRDLEASIAFYRDVLGVPLVRDDHDPHWAEAHLPGGLRFALHRAHEGAVPQTPGTITIDFAVEDIELAARRLREAGATVDEITREAWGAAATTYDPDGYRISLYQASGR